ncbi:MAG: 50S ribosomal protein L24 [Atopobium sp.]|uniref:50S ribosomal protein L24 n=1 Tax=Atopobium sp. TaxID=1872650 RepID=UPI002A753C30|nr:50S ribosomal protein L24 [Atopobium sp.]MDY2787837.1 50S ribosomal protein L24 [Atopobium sp.]MDY4523013.1 50S ribosomal protein L24 [Atopobium sp.]
MKIKKDDLVVVLSGKDKGKQGKVLRALPSKNKVVVEGVAIVKKAMRPTQANQQGGIVSMEAPIDASNVALIDPKDGKPTRVGYRVSEDGTKVRYAKRSGEEI